MYITPDELFAKTNGGLDIILAYYPNAQDSVNNPKKPFKIRDDDDTPSTFLKQYKGVWRVTDFGDDSKALSPIDVAMKEEGLRFNEAINRLADQFRVEGSFTPEINRAKYDKREATAEEPEGHFAFELNDEFTDFELKKVLGPLVKAEHCARLRYYPVKWYSTTKDRKTTVVSSTPKYPIFMRDCGTFQKFYIPLNKDKKYRFFCNPIGVKESDFINGLEELEKAFRDNADRQTKEFYSDPLNEGKPFEPEKLDEAVICSGERDALCCIAYGYQPIWFNSETYQLPLKDYKRIMKFVKRLYNVPDIDSTGVRAGTALALEFLDIYTVWLPPWLSTYKDMRGNPRKDLRDFAELRPGIVDFKNLLKIACPARFWESVLTDKGQRLEINTHYLFHFLRLAGFYTIEDKNLSRQFSYVRVVDGIIYKIKEFNEIHSFLTNFITSRYFDISIVNLVHNSRRVNDQNISKIARFKPNLIDYTKYTQLLFFKNKCWNVTPEGIFEQKYASDKINVWEERLLPLNVKRIEPAFKVSFSEDDTIDIDVYHTRSKYFSFLINASRIHWRQELEIRETLEREEYNKKYKFAIDGPLLTSDEIEEQKLHLVNKIFCIGYLLHRYKSPDRAWCVFSMDNKIGDEGESNGRSGKSAFMYGISKLKKTTYQSGKNKSMGNNAHMFDRVNEYTELLWLDDAYDYFPFDILFDKITGDFEVNPKNNQSYAIPFDESPKIGITSNYIIRENDPSTEGRLLFTVFSDYYHVKTTRNDYKETREISSDFGGNILKGDYTEEDWNNDFNFFAECLLFYLSTIDKRTSTGEKIKINPPMDVVSQRRLKAQMGQAFEDWANVFFSPEGDNVNALVSRKDAYEDCRTATNQPKLSPQKFMDRLKAFCESAPYISEFNPREFRNCGSRIIKKDNNVSTEMIYIKTNDNFTF